MNMFVPPSNTKKSHHVLNMCRSVGAGIAGARFEDLVPYLRRLLRRKEIWSENCPWGQPNETELSGRVYR